MTRRAVCGLGVFALLVVVWCVRTAVAAPDLAAVWQNYKQHFISSDGRVIDWQNKHMSHSEGQGYTLLLAVELNDPETFAKVLKWSDDNLGCGLRAWSWGHSQEGWRVLDRNNATDGDIFHAWALLLAGKKWDKPEYTRVGLDIMQAIRKELVDDRGYLLPARWGFQTPNETRLNLSYYVFPAFRVFAEADPEHATFWNTVYTKGLALYRESLNTPAKLPPDWVSVDVKGKLMPQGGSDATFGFEAICIPIFLSWPREKAALEPLRPFLTRIAAQGWMPQTVDLLEPQYVPGPNVFEAGTGHYAAAARAAETLGMTAQAARLWQLAEKSREKNKRNYYGEVLYLLARVL